jgi:membrane protein DedA with SNARE-associated domain
MEVGAEIGEEEVGEDVGSRRLVGPSLGSFTDRSEAFIKTYGGASVFLARFIAVVRAFVPLVADILGMSSRQFYVVNILSAFAWAPAHIATEW